MGRAFWGPARRSSASRRSGTGSWHGQLYGASGSVPTPTEHHRHVEPDGELADAWFVVFDGAGEDARKVALVCEETDPGRYRGFWTRRPALVDETVAYLQETHPVPSPMPSD